MFSNWDSFSAPPFWHNGPSPGNIYKFPSPNTSTISDNQQPQNKGPITTTTSLVALTFDKGVIIAGDILASYGSLARFRKCPRVLKINDNIVLGAGGDYGDFQFVKYLIDQKITKEECLDDGHSMTPKSLYCWLTRMMYNMRSKFSPLWNNFIVGGLDDGVPYLGTVDKLGTAYEDKIICTGYGTHIALPSLRKAYDANPELNETEAKVFIEKAMEVLYYRDARSFPKYQRAIINQQGINIEGPLEVKQNWTIAHRSH